MPAVPDSVETLLQQMVRLNTVNTAVSGDPLIENKLADLNQSVAEAMGFATRRLPVVGRADNLLVTFTADATRPWIMFESHMDTVTTEAMTVDPLGADIRDGRMWGRGTCDTKGTGAAMLWALHDYAQGGEHPNNVAVVFTVDEEYGMTGVTSLVENDYATLGFAPVGIVVGEPTMCQPIVAHNGCARLKVVTRGVAAHSSRPAAGRSAISDMMRIIDRIESTYIPSLSASHPLIGKAQCSINLIRGGVQINIIPEHCEIEIDRRIVPGEDPGAVRPALEKLLAEVAREHPGIDASVKVYFTCNPLRPEPSRDFLPHVQRVLDSLHIPSTGEGRPYCTDAGELAAAGLPVVVLGPGDMTKAHTKDEYLELDQLHQGVKVYGELMRANFI